MSNETRSFLPHVIRNATHIAYHSQVDDIEHVVAQRGEHQTLHLLLLHDVLDFDRCRLGQVARHGLVRNDVGHDLSHLPDLRFDHNDVSSLVLTLTLLRHNYKASVSQELANNALTILLLSRLRIQKHERLLLLLLFLLPALDRWQLLHSLHVYRLLATRQAILLLLPLVVQNLTQHALHRARGDAHERLLLHITPKQGHILHITFHLLSHVGRPVVLEHVLNVVVDAVRAVVLNDAVLRQVPPRTLQ